MLVSKYIKVLKFKKTQSFPNKGTKHKNNYMEGLNLKNKIIMLKVANPLEGSYHSRPTQKEAVFKNFFEVANINIDIKLIGLNK